MVLVELILIKPQFTWPRGHIQLNKRMTIQLLGGENCPQTLWKNFYLNAVFTLDIAEIVLNLVLNYNQSTAVINEKFG